MQRYIISLVLFILAFPGLLLAKEVSYELRIGYKEVNYSGKSVQAMSINGGIPGPTLRFKEGDKAKIKVYNDMDVESSIHWHGILLPNLQDGVPYLTTPPILPGKSLLYEFPIKHSGTYWYHSHTSLQEQRGVYGSIAIQPKQARKDIKFDREYVLVLSDWTDENPHKVLRSLKRGSEYYSFKKGATQSLWGAVKAGAIPDILKNSLIRMPPMDISDVAYDAFLSNGKRIDHLKAKAGERIRLRIINAGASTYFYLSYAGGNMTIINADGVDVKPVKKGRMLMTVAETYDVIVTVPNVGKAFEFRATAQDGSGHTSLFIGSGKKVLAQDIPKPNLYKLHSGHDMSNMSDPNHDHQAMMARPMTPYAALQSTTSSAFSKERPVREVELKLTGDMQRYVWSFNNKTLKEADKISIKKGEVVRFKFVNTTMMHHPLHLHGHFFRVLGGQGDYAPLKHTVDVPPMGNVTIEFAADEDKDWFFHCHILYHMKSGMTRIIHYEGSTVDPIIQEARKLPGNPFGKDPWYAWADVAGLSQMTHGEVTAANTRNTFITEWEVGDWDDVEYEVELKYSRYFNRFFSAFAGVDLTNEENDHRGIFGVNYLLPFLIESEVWVDTKGEFRFAGEKEIQLTSRVSAFAKAEYDTESEWEWMAGGEFMLTRYISLIGQYHSDFYGGGGLMVRF